MSGEKRQKSEKLQGAIWSFSKMVVAGQAINSIGKLYSQACPMSSPFYGGVDHV